MAKKLSAQRARFVAEYLVDLNATQAAIRAGYSERTAYSSGQRLLKAVEVQQALQAAQAKREQRVQIDQDYVLRRLAEIDQMDVADILGDDGEYKPVKQWPKVWRQFISGMDIAEIAEGRGEERVVVGVLKKVKWPDKVKNLELLGKHVTVGAFQENVKLGVTVDLADAIVEARKRARAKDS